jgi:hypothetical protein
MHVQSPYFIHLNGRYHLQLASWIIWSFLASHHPDLRLAWELQRSSFPTVTKPSPSCLLSLVKRSETCLQVHRILGGIILEDSMVGTPVPAVTQSFNHKFAIYSSWPSYATQSSVNLVHILDCFLFILWLVEQVGNVLQVVLTLNDEPTYTIHNVQKFSNWHFYNNHMIKEHGEHGASTRYGLGSSYLLQSDVLLSIQSPWFSPQLLTKSTTEYKRRVKGIDL